MFRWKSNPAYSVATSTPSAEVENSKEIKSPFLCNLEANTDEKSNIVNSSFNHRDKGTETRMRQKFNKTVPRL